MPMATFFTLGKITMQSALSRILVGKPLSPERMACIAVAELARRSSSFFCAKRDEAIARHNMRVRNRLFTVCPFEIEVSPDRTSGSKSYGRLTGWCFGTKELYTD